jgi:predicted nucleic acid-binding protein
VIILDANVLDALMRTVPDPAVVVWLDRQPADSVALEHLCEHLCEPVALIRAMADITP